MVIYISSIVLSLVFFLSTMIDLKKKKFISALILILTLISHPEVSFFLTGSSDSETLSMVTSIVALLAGIFIFSKEYSVFYKALSRILFLSLFFSALIFSSINLGDYLGYYGGYIIGILPLIYIVLLLGIVLYAVFKSQMKKSTDNSDVLDQN